MRNFLQKSDEELFALMVRGDVHAFTKIYDRYLQVLLNVAYQRLKSIEKAEEVVQDVFLNLYTRRSEIQLKRSLSAYLHQAVQYKVYNVYRAQMINQHHLEIVKRSASAEPATPYDLLQMKELEQRVQGVAANLPEKCREVFLLSRMEQLSHQEISEKMNISINTVKKHLTKALSMFKSYFGYDKISG